MKQKKYILLLIIFIFIILFVSIACASMSLSEQTELNKAKSIKNSENSVIAEVNGEKIYLWELNYSIETVKGNMIFMEQIKEKNVLNKEKAKVMEKYDLKTIAFAGRLCDAAVIREGKNRGIKVSDKTIQEKIEETKKLLKNNNEDLQGLKVFVEEIGEDYYYNEYLPKIIKKHMTIGKLKSEVCKSERSAFEIIKKWHKFELDLVRNANIKILDKDILSDVDKKNALKYLEEYFAVDYKIFK